MLLCDAWRDTHAKQDDDGGDEGASCIMSSIGDRIEEAIMLLVRAVKK
jgi:hypothetical protein